MEVVLALVVPAVALGVVAWLAASRWPRPVEAPSLPPAEPSRLPGGASGLAAVFRRRTDPEELTGLALTVALAVLALGVLGVGLLLQMVNTDSGFARWDLGAARFGADHASPWTTHLLRAVTLLGGVQGVLVIAVVVAVGEVRRTGSRAVVGFLVVVIGGQYVVVEVMKRIIDRDRPDLLNLADFASTSFPSGHSTAAAATWMAVAFLVGRGRGPRVRARLVGVAAGIAGAVAASRVLLGVHWLTDVLAGVLLGWAWFAVCSIAFGGTVLRFGAPVAQTHAAARGRGPTP